MLKCLLSMEQNARNFKITSTTKQSIARTYQPPRRNQRNVSERKGTAKNISMIKPQSIVFVK
ncbi:MAG: hypothetical protein LBT18_04205 [Endomicrobium sp.]|nr:hypothetical protein [Endomicrobium sp.]